MSEWYARVRVRKNTSKLELNNMKFTKFKKLKTNNIKNK